MIKIHTIKRSITIICTIFLIVSAIPCFAVNDDDDSIVVVDQRGKSVTIPKNIERIVVVPKPSASLIVTIDGTDERIVGMHPDAKALIDKGNILGRIAPDLKNASTDFVKSDFEPNVEEILKLKPDVVIQWADRGDDIIAPIEAAGIPTIGIVFGEFENTTKLFGKILGKEDRADKLIVYYRNLHQDIRTKTSKIPTENKPRILTISRGNEGQFSISGFDWIDLCGGINVASDLGTYGKSANLEQITAWNPDILYIFLSAGFAPDKILNNEIEGQDWSSIKAVKNGKVYAIPEGAHWWGPPNQEIPLMWEWLVEIQYPDLFDFDLRQDIADFYSEYYDYNVSSDEIDEILHCDMNQGLACCAHK